VCKDKKLFEVFKRQAMRLLGGIFLK